MDFSCNDSIVITTKKKEEILNAKASQAYGMQKKKMKGTLRQNGIFKRVFMQTII